MGKIVVTGMSTPSDMKEFVKRGTVKTVVLWNSVDLGYRAVYAAQASLAGTLKDNPTQAKCHQGGWARATRSHRSRTSRPRGRSH